MYHLNSSKLSRPSPSLSKTTMADLTETSNLPLKSPPFREDCWTEEATATLVNAWGRRYVDLNRGNLRQKDWQEVADAVNSRHGQNKKTRRTDVQCKNRIDTLKKKYKVEKARVSESNGAVTSNWMFYDQLDFLIGPKMSEMRSPTLAIALPIRKGERSEATPPLAVALPQKRSAASVVDDSYFRRNYSAVAAAAAAAVDEDDDEDEDVSEESGGAGAGAAAAGKVHDGMKMMAKAIERFGEMYERVERAKQLQMIELEKQRMQFAKDLEVQRMQLLMDTQVQLEKAKHARRSGSGSDDIYQ